MTLLASLLDIDWSICSILLSKDFDGKPNETAIELTRSGGES